MLEKTPEAQAEIDRILLELRRRRGHLGLTQRALAAKLGWRQAQVCTLERGKVLPMLNTLVIYAAALGATINVVDVVEESDD